MNFVTASLQRNIVRIFQDAPAFRQFFLFELDDAPSQGCVQERSKITAAERPVSREDLDIALVEPGGANPGKDIAGLNRGDLETQSVPPLKAQLVLSRFPRCDNRAAIVV